MSFHVWCSTLCETLIDESRVLASASRRERRVAYKKREWGSVFRQEAAVVETLKRETTGKGRSETHQSHEEKLGMCARLYEKRAPRAMSVAFSDIAFTGGIRGVISDLDSEAGRLHLPTFAIAIRINTRYRAREILWLLRISKKNRVFQFYYIIQDVSSQIWKWNLRTLEGKFRDFSMVKMYKEPKT